MHQDFWQARWASNQIGFHLMEVNPQLVRHQDVLSGARRVLVPLCGKSLDLAWLAGLGYAVQGVELAERAVIDFFREQQIEPGIREQDGFRIYSAGALELWCGDFFDLQAQHLAGCGGFYDRAALIALPPAMRQRYAEHVAHILPSGCRGLLVSLDYPQAQMNGPPFAVPEQEIRELYGAGWELECLAREYARERSWRFLTSPLDYLEESVYRLRRRA
jgi:thiopurine S-methyltransferase